MREIEIRIFFGNIQSASLTQGRWGAHNKYVWCTRSRLLAVASDNEVLTHNVETRPNEKHHQGKQQVTDDSLVTVEKYKAGSYWGAVGRKVASTVERIQRVLSVLYS
jgi:hypothetical protein